MRIDYMRRRPLPAFTARSRRMEFIFCEVTYMSLIQITDLTFAYDGSWDNVFDHASLQLDTRWRLGLVGRNGRGKTTLLRLLMGKYEYAGAISASVTFDYFPFPVPRPERDAMEVAEELLPETESWELYRELSALEMDPEILFRPFSSLSNGEQTKLLLAVLFLRPNRFLLLDEPTNHLDLEGRQVVSRYLGRKQGFILVSHDRAFLDGCVDHILSINKQNFDLQQGNFSSWWANKQRRDQWERSENEKLRRDIARLDAAARRTAAWSDKAESAKFGTGCADRGFVGHRAAKVMKRAKAAENRRREAAEEKSALLKNIEQTPPLKLHPLSHPKQRLVEADHLAADYGLGPVCAPVSFSLMQGERLALTGRNGTGKSSLLRLVCGEELPHTGTLSLASGLVVSVAPQDPSSLRGDLTSFAAESGIDETLFKTILRKLDFSRSQFEKDMAGYSAGQKKKVLLARSLCQSAHLYVWDEPLNYVDLFSRMQLEQLILEYRPTMLLVEHDRSFLDAVATRVVHLERRESR